MICFDKSIYPEDVVYRACRDYKDLAEIRIREQDDQLVCEFSNVQANPELIADEFDNYVLNLTVMIGGAKR